MSAPTFDLPRYLQNSRRLEVEDLDWDAVSDHPITPEEVRALTYDMDIESNTIIYVRELLSTPAADDPEITSFLSCWAYEEFFHGYMIKRFLRACGVPVAENRLAEVVKGRSPGYRIQQVAQAIVSKLSGAKFIAVHMTWGAIHELTTLQGYQILSERTQHPVLRELLRRIVKDERRHFAFYYNQAKIRLLDPAARRLTSFLVHRYWDLVGSGEVPDAEVDFLVEYLLQDETSMSFVDYVHKTIQALPGMESWKGLDQVIARTRKRQAHRVAIA
jgi:rubrerythrin